MRLPAAALLAVLLALAGCSGHGDGTGTGGGTTSSSEPQPVDEPDTAVFQVTFDSEAPATLDVPFPHLDSCLQPEDWMNGTVTAGGGAQAQLDEQDRGRVVAVSGQGSVSWSVQVDLTAKPTCQTFRYDPWSIDPDPEDGTVEVRQGGSVVQHATVLVREVRGGCGSATLYEGTPEGDGWTALPGHTIPVGGGCSSGSSSPGGDTTSST